MFCKMTCKAAAVCSRAESASGGRVYTKLKQVKKMFSDHFFVGFNLTYVKKVF
jgi:hypothetical protein